MKKEFKRVLALVLAVVMVIGLTACGDKKEDETGGGNVSTKPLVVGYAQFSQKFSPFYADTAYDQDVVAMTQASLMTTDRKGEIIKKGIKGETKEYNGKKYKYKGIADLDWSYDEAKDQTVYKAKIRDDVKFSDGKPMTADDIIFTYYVYLDKSYVGSTTLNSYPIVGLQNYKLNSTKAESVNVSEDEVAAMLAKPNEEMTAFIKEKILATLTAEKDWCTENFAAKGAPSAEEFFVTSYGAAVNYTFDKAKNYDTIVAEVAAAYGVDYKKLAEGYAGDATYFDKDMNAKAQSIVKKIKVDAAGGEEVPNIAGIKKTGDYTVEVTVKGFSAPAVYSILGIQVVPLHYYGDKSLYNYDKNQFGFKRGDLSAVQKKIATPLGAGPYVFKEYKNKTVYFKSNPNYILGEPKIKDLQFKEVTTEQMASNVKTGVADCGEMTGSVDRFNEVKKMNSNGEITGNIISTSKVDNLGYGYIGINADTVNVGGDAKSDASKNLRKAIMTILSVYRDTTVDTYYGEAASVINYPISNTSWAAPQVTDEGYKVAYSTNVDGKAIYTSEMSAEDKYQAAIEATKGYLKAAGYTFDDASGKFKAAPAGAKMSYTAIIPGEGKGQHPSYGVLTDAKAALASIGIELIINDPANTNVLWDSLDAGTQELFCAAWGASLDPDMYQIYYSGSIVGKGGSDSNHYHIADSKLDELIVAARKSEDQGYRKSVYKECMEKIMDWAVELPVYQRQNCIIFSTERVKMNTVTPDITTFYKWYYEIEKMEMK